MTASPAEFAFCPHDRGPGIAICLRCRADTHRKAALSRRRIATRVAIGTMVLMVLVVAATNSGTARGATGNSAPVPTSTSTSTSTASSGGRSESFQVVQAGSAPSEVTTHATNAAVLEPVIPAGRTDLQDGAVADRSGDSVIVRFDTQLLRTRRRDKFEQIVRLTLPAVYGAVADSVLSAIPAGEIASTGNLTTELPTQGVRLPARAGWALTLWPMTRPGQDGPLVVSFRVTSARAQ